jgi:hypothetical protein
VLCIGLNKFHILHDCFRASPAVLLMWPCTVKSD